MGIYDVARVDCPPSRIDHRGFDPTPQTRRGQPRSTRSNCVAPRLLGVRADSSGGVLESRSTPSTQMRPTR